MLVLLYVLKKLEETHDSVSEEHLQEDQRWRL